MNQPSANRPNPAIQRLYHEANQAWAQQDYEKSISLFEQATRVEPRNPALFLNLAHAYGKRYDFPAAERCFEKAVQMSTERALTLGEAGKVCLQFDNMDMAVTFFQRATHNQEVSIATLVTLADIYLRDKRLDEAAELLARAAQIDRKDQRLLVEEAILRRLRGNATEAEPLLREVLAMPSSGAPARIHASYELAGILDEAGKYDEAVTALLEAKALLRPNVAQHAAILQHMQRRAKEMEQSITAGVLDRWRTDVDKFKPLRRTALLCGHPRSGTTLLEQVLDTHSDITTAEETKVMHDEAYLPLIRDFPEGTSVLQALDSAPPSRIRQARENYFRCLELFLRRKIGDRLLVDKNPSLNLMIPMVVRVFPEMKFLVALRDPRDVVISCFFLQAVPFTPVSSAYLSLEGTVNQYANVMGFWLEMAPRLGGQWMYVRYEEMVEDLPAVARSVLDFLGVQFENNVLNFYEHARTKRLISPSRQEVRKPLYRSAMGRWRNYQNYLEPYLAGLDRFVKAFNYQ